jgi:hypothetical protein
MEGEPDLRRWEGRAPLCCAYIHHAGSTNLTRGFGVGLYPFLPLTKGACYILLFLVKPWEHQQGACSVLGDRAGSRGGRAGGQTADPLSACSAVLLLVWHTLPHCSCSCAKCVVCLGGL